MSAATTRWAPPASPSIPTRSADEAHATVLAHENVLLRMSAPKGRQTTRCFRSLMWPTETFTSRFRSMYLNDDAIQVMRADRRALRRRQHGVLPPRRRHRDRRHPRPAALPGHRSPPRAAASRASSTRSTGCWTSPFRRCRSCCKPGRTLLVPGHGRVSDYGELVEYRDMVTIIKDIIEDMIKKGMTLEQVKAANPDRGLPRAVRGRFGAMDHRHVRRGHLQRPQEAGGEVVNQGARHSGPLLLIALRRCSADVCPRNVWAQGRGRGAARSGHAASDGAVRSDGLLGGDRFRGLALADGHARQGRLSQHSDEPPRDNASPKRGIRPRTKRPASSAARMARPV